MHYTLSILGFINVDLLWKALGSLRLIRVRFYRIISDVPQMTLLVWFGLVSNSVEARENGMLSRGETEPAPSAVSQEPGVSSACFPSIMSASSAYSPASLRTQLGIWTRGLCQNLVRLGGKQRVMSSPAGGFPPSGFGNWDKSIPAQAVPALTGCQIRLASSAVPNAGKSQSMLKRHKAKNRRKQRALTV